MENRDTIEANIAGMDELELGILRLQDEVAALVLTSPGIWYLQRFHTILHHACAQALKLERLLPLVFGCRDRIELQG